MEIMEVKKMEKRNRINCIRKMLVLLLVLALMLISTSSLLAERPVDCMDAYLKCLRNALSYIISNLSYSIMQVDNCSLGYRWCLDFYG